MVLFKYFIYSNHPFSFKQYLGSAYITNFLFSPKIQTGYNHIFHNSNNCVNAQFGYSSLKSLLSITNNSIIVLTATLAETLAASLAETLAASFAASLAASLAETKTESLAEAENQTETQAEDQSESQFQAQATFQAKSQSSSVSSFLYSTSAFIQKHFNTNLACLSTSDFFKSLLGLNQPIFFKCSIKSFTLFCIFFGSNFQLSSFSSSI
jgi:hypothetical protein